MLISESRQKPVWWRHWDQGRAPHKLQFLLSPLRAWSISSPEAQHDEPWKVPFPPHYEVAVKLTSNLTKTQKYMHTYICVLMGKFWQGKIWLNVKLRFFSMMKKMICRNLFAQLFCYYSDWTCVKLFYIYRVHHTYLPWNFLPFSETVLHPWGLWSI